MSSYCGVHGCRNNSKTKPQLSYFSLPKDEDRRKTWIERMRREDLLTKETRSKHYVCSEHFSKDTIKNKRLKSDATPSLHLGDPRDSNDYADQNSGSGEESCVTIEIKKEPMVFLPPDMEQSGECPSPSASSSQLQISSSRTIKRSFSSQSSVHSEGMEIPPETSQISQVHQQKPDMEQPYDEYDHFGLMIASKIRKIEQFEERETVMNVIQNIVFQSVMKTRTPANESS